MVLKSKKVRKPSKEEIPVEDAAAVMDIDVKSIKIGQAQADKIPSEKMWYPIEFVRAVAKTGAFGPYLVFIFKLLGGEDDDGNSVAGAELIGMADAKDICPGRQVYDHFIKPIVGFDPELNSDIDLTAHYGKKYQGFVEYRVNKKTKEKKIGITQVKRIAKKAKE